MIRMAEYEIERVCQVCGKHFDVLYKDLWAYKKARAKGRYNFYCSWKCMREAETNKKPKPEPQKRENKERLQVLVELMAAVKDGRDAYDYLQGMGYADPKDTLRRLRITAKKDAPEIYQWMEQNGLLDMRKGRSGKGVDKVSNHKLTREQKGKAVDIAIQGGDFMDYLRKCGSKNPSAAWFYIRKTLKEANPNKYLELINLLSHPEKKEPEKGQLAEVAEKLPPEAAAEVPEADPLAGFVAYDPGAPEGDKTAYQRIKVTEKEAPCMTLHNPQKENKMEYTVMSIKTKAGTFSIDEEERISWRGGKSCTTMKKEDWEELADILPEVLEILGR